MVPTFPKGLMWSLLLVLGVIVTSSGAQGQLDGDYVTCYYYTWTGRNESVECEDYKLDVFEEPQPCLDTLIYTDPYDKPPNVSDIKRHCDTVEKCPSYTCRERKNCVKLMWYDITGKVVNYSAFCGNVIIGADTTDPRPVVNEFLEMQVGSFKKKLWVCNTHLCNSAPSLFTRSPAAATLCTTLVFTFIPLLLSMIITPSNSISLSSSSP